MFPFLTAKQIDTAASYYTALNTALPTALNQSIAVMGECSHVSLILDTAKYRSSNLLQHYLFARRIPYSRHSTVVLGR
jgi:hypothetical protein